jgi:outer membrane protein
MMFMDQYIKQIIFPAYRLFNVIRTTKKTILILLLCSVSAIQAQTQLDRYIQEAFTNNLVIQEKKLELDKGLIAIKEARSLFMPTTWFETQYTLAKGGRAINIPIGDLLNPVYNTLNQLTASNKFPNVNNVNEQFLPNNFYDVRLKTTMPLINPDIAINRNIKQQEVQLKENEILIYKRELAKEIKIAYFNYLMSGKAVMILEEALVLVQQNLKLNQSLLNNGKGLPAHVTRAESELFSVQNQLLNAKNNVLNVTAYFNFLLNRPLTDSLINEEFNITDIQLESLMAAEDDVQKREELKSFSMARAITGNILKMNRSFSKPRLNSFLDIASQGFDFKVNRQSFFYLGGLQLQIPIYSGKRNLYKIDQTQLEIQRLEKQTEQTKHQLQLAALNVRNNARNAYNTWLASVKQAQSAAQYFSLSERGYKEGVTPFIEFLDARNQLTASQLQTNINKYQFFIGLAEYERHIASYQIQ